jgi:hypothetical protein
MGRNIFLIKGELLKRNVVYYCQHIYYSLLRVCSIILMNKSEPADVPFGERDVVVSLGGESKSYLYISLFSSPYYIGTEKA